jgi:peptidyl-prolyl cis-trans isomerase D
MKKIISIFIILFLSLLSQHIKAQTDAYNNLSSLRTDEQEAQAHMFWAVRYFERDSIEYALNGHKNHSGLLDIINKYGNSKAANLAHYYIGLCYMRKNEYKEAISTMNMFSANDQIVSSFAIGIVGDAYMELGDISKAAEYYLKAAYKNNNLYSTPLFLMKAGNTYELLGQYTKALKLYNCIKQNYYSSFESREINKYVEYIKGLLSLSSIDTTGSCSCSIPKNVVNKIISSKNDIGNVSGKGISYLDFENNVNMIKSESGVDKLSQSRIFNIKNEVWNNFVREDVLTTEYDSLGIEVSSSELTDLIQGEEPHQYIVQNFADPLTGKFDVASVHTLIDNLDLYEQEKPGIKKQWQELIDLIKSDRLYTKYLNLIKEGYYIPKALAKREYELRNTTGTYHYIAAKYSDIPDNTVTLTDNDYQKYYNEHKQEYDQQPSRDIEYIIWNVIPSDSDKAKLKRLINKIANELKKKTDKDIPAFVKEYSDDIYDSAFHKKSELPVLLDTTVFKSKKGQILGPFLDNNMYTLAKVMEFQVRPDSMRASHILISYKNAYRASKNIGRTKEQASQTVDSLLKILSKNPDQFENICKSISDDPSSKARGGDLNWFYDGMMVSTFNDACLNGKIGKVKKVETEFGYHIVKVTGKKDFENKVRLAVIKLKIEPGIETFQDTYTKAVKFPYENPTIDMAEKSIVNDKLNYNIHEYVSENSDSLKGLESARNIIRWAFDEKTKKGAASIVFDLGSQYVVAYVKESRDKGIPSLEQIKKLIKPLVVIEKKAEILISKIKNVELPGISIDMLAQKLNQTVSYSNDGITFSYLSIPNYSSEHEVVGRLFSSKVNTLSEPIQSHSGIFVICAEKFNRPPDISNYDSTSSWLLKMHKGRAQYDVYNALLKNAVIEDKRRLFY